MPGFKVGKLGPDSNEGGATADVNAYYSFTWLVEQLLEKVKSEGPTVYLREVTLPTFSVNKETVKGASVEYKFAGSVTYDDVKLTWYDTAGLLTIIKEWRTSVWTAETGIGYANDYKKKSVIRSFLPHELPEDGNKWELINSWPSTIRHGELSYTQSDIKVVEVTLTYDWAEETPANSKPSDEENKSSKTGKTNILGNVPTTRYRTGGQPYY